MVEQIQELIDKIKEEGVQAAEKQAENIINEAKQKAESIINKAKQEADHIVAEAKKEIEQERNSARENLKHAARDMILSLKEEIQKILQSIVSVEVHDALSKDKLTDILTVVIKNSIEKDTSEVEIEVFLNPEDCKILEEGFMARLKEEGIKRPICFRSAEDIEAGFKISFDGGKSHFDFTDKSLAEYLARFLNPKVADLVKESAFSDK